MIVFGFMINCERERTEMQKTKTMNGGEYKKENKAQKVMERVRKKEILLLQWHNKVNAKLFQGLNN
jgi:hypothetical protein